MKVRLVIVGLSSNSGGGSFTLELSSARESEIVVIFALVAPIWGGDYELASTVMTAQLPLSTFQLKKLLDAIDAWLKTDVRNAELLNGEHQLAASESLIFDISFGKRNKLISSAEKPTVTLQYKFGNLHGELTFITDQSCLRDFSQGLKKMTTPIEE